jgi:hypothetical protein
MKFPRFLPSPAHARLRNHSNLAALNSFSLATEEHWPRSASKKFMLAHAPAFSIMLLWSGRSEFARCRVCTVKFPYLTLFFSVKVDISASAYYPYILNFVSSIV